MFLSIFTDELDGDFKESLPVLHAWGFKYCDLRGRILGKKVHDLTQTDLAEGSALLKKYDMKIGALQTKLAKVHLPDEEIQKSEMDKLEGIIRVADALNCRLIRVFHFWKPNPSEKGTLHQKPEELQRVIDMFAPYAERAQSENLVFAFENCGETPEEVFAVLNKLNNAEWGLAWDVFNTWDCDERNKDEDAYIARHAQRSIMIHVKAASIIPALTDKPLPWKRILSACEKSGLKGPVSIETHNTMESGLSNTEASRQTTELIRDAWPL